MPSDDSKRRQEARKAASTGAVPSFLSIFAHAADRFEDPAPVVEGEPVGDGDLTIERGPNLDEAEQTPAATAPEPAPAPEPVEPADAVEQMYRQEVAKAAPEAADEEAPHAARPNRPRPADGREAMGVPRKPAPAAISNPKEDIASLNDLERHLYAHRYARIGISCYGPSIDPAKAVTDRGEAQAILEQEDKELVCNPETGAMLERLNSMPDILTETQKAQVKILRRDRAQMVDVPDDVQMDFTRLLAESDSVWQRAKAANDFASFEPYLDRIVQAMVKIAHYRNADACLLYTSPSPRDS